jgi:hypothetical protein
LGHRKCDHTKIPGLFSSLQEVLSEVPFQPLEVDVFLDIRMAGLVKDDGDLVVADQS